MAVRPRTGRPSLAALPEEEPDAEDRNSDDSRRGLTRRQVRRLVRRGLHDRHPGAGQAADDAASARCGGRSRHRLHDLRLPRLAARQLRPGAVAGAALPGGARRALPAGCQRGHGRHRAVGHAAGGALPRREARRGLRHLVRQGAGRRPHHRRLQARQQRRHRAARRRARAGGRRSCLRVVHHGAPERVRLRQRRHAGAQPGRRPGVPGLRPARLGALALCRPLGRLHLHRRDGGELGHRLGRPPSRDDRHAGRPCAAAGRAQHPPAGCAARPGGAPARAQARRCPRLRPRQRARPHA